MNSNNDSLDLITRERTTELLNISPSTLDRWSREKLIERYKLGRKIYYKRSDIISFVEKNKI